MAEAGRVWSLRQLRDGQRSRGCSYEEVLRVAALSAGVYTLPAGSEDRQSPHREDEVYAVLAGRGSVDIAGDREAVAPGSLVYVPAGVPHRFVDITEDLEVLVVFAPPESSRGAGD